MSKLEEVTILKGEVPFKSGEILVKDVTDPFLYNDGKGCASAYYVESSKDNKDEQVITFTALQIAGDSFTNAKEVFPEREVMQCIITNALMTAVNGYSEGLTEEGEHIEITADNLDIDLLQSYALWETQEGTTGLPYCEVYKD